MPAEETLKPFYKTKKFDFYQHPLDEKKETLRVVAVGSAGMVSKFEGRMPEILEHLKSFEGHQEIAKKFKAQIEASR